MKIPHEQHTAVRKFTFRLLGCMQTHRSIRMRETTAPAAHVDVVGVSVHLTSAVQPSSQVPQQCALIDTGRQPAP